MDLSLYSLNSLDASTTWGWSWIETTTTAAALWMFFLDGHHGYWCPKGNSSIDGAIIWTDCRWMRSGAPDRDASEWGFFYFLLFVQVFSGSLLWRAPWRYGAATATTPSFREPLTAFCSFFPSSTVAGGINYPSVLHTSSWPFIFSPAFLCLSPCSLDYCSPAPSPHPMCYTAFSTSSVVIKCIHSICCT